MRKEKVFINPIIHLMENQNNLLNNRLNINKNKSKTRISHFRMISNISRKIKDSKMRNYPRK